MTYQGERARDPVSLPVRVFEVTHVRLTDEGLVSDVRWREVDSASGHDVGDAAEATMAEVVEAIHEGARVSAWFEAPEPLPRHRAFEVLMQEDGAQRLALVQPTVPGRELADLSSLPSRAASPATAAVVVRTAPTRPRKAIHAVSAVRLDADGRITHVRWGRVDPVRNDWAAPEVVAPVAQVVDALNAKQQVFALFPSVHGHLPDRQFAVANYDGNRNTVVLDGPAAYEREVHDMDRLDAKA